VKWKNNLLVSDFGTRRPSASNAGQGRHSFKTCTPIGGLAGKSNSSKFSG